jgi:hypothetical protein
VIKISIENKPKFSLRSKQSNVQPPEVLIKGKLPQSLELKQDPTIKPQPDQGMELKL